MDANDVRRTVWRSAVQEAKRELLRACPTLAGGVQQGETEREYARRGIAAIEERLWLLELIEAEERKACST